MTSSAGPDPQPIGTTVCPQEPRLLVRIERHGDGGHVAELVLDRPEAMNAVSTAKAEAIAAATSALAADPSVRCVVLTSSHPKAFCVGADLKERNTMTDADLMAQRPLARAAYGGVLALPMPAVAAVDGFAFGGGLELALSCDLLVAGDGAIVGLPEVSVGVIPGGGRHDQRIARRGCLRLGQAQRHAERLGQRHQPLTQLVFMKQRQTVEIEGVVVVRRLFQQLQRGLQGFQKPGAAAAPSRQPHAPPSAWSWRHRSARRSA